MQKAIDMLSEVKESIMNAYEIKTGLSRAKISHLMDAETWMNANKAVELGFADDIIGRETQDSTTRFVSPTDTMMFSCRTATNTLLNKISRKAEPKQQSVAQAAAMPAAEQTEPQTNTPTERSVADLMERLELIKNHI